MLSIDQSNYHHLILRKPINRTLIPIQRYLATNAEQAKVESVPRKIERNLFDVYIVLNCFSKVRKNINFKLKLNNYYIL